MNLHRAFLWTTFSIVAGVSVTSTAGQFPTSEVPTAEPEYIAKVKTAAPASIVDGATIVMVQGNGERKALQTGSNGFTCLVDSHGTPLCADANAMEWRKSIGDKTAPPDKTGFIYMMAGDVGTSNHDPYATDKSHWVQTGPHVMIVGAAAREMVGLYPHAMDPDPSQAYVMFPGTPYEHLMLPVDSQPSAMK